MTRVVPRQVLLQMAYIVKRLDWPKEALAAQVRRAARWTFIESPWCRESPRCSPGHALPPRPLREVSNAPAARAGRAEWTADAGPGERRGVRRGAGRAVSAAARRVAAADGVCTKTV